MQLELNRALTPEARIQMVLDLSELAREFAKGRLRAQYSDASEEELRRILTEEMYGRP